MSEDIILDEVDRSEYEKQTWIDHIVDEETGIVKQWGTPHSAKRMNHMEQGIFDANRKGNLSLEEIEYIRSTLILLENDLRQTQDQTESMSEEINYILTELENAADNNAIDDLVARLKRLEDAVMSNITGNPFEISLKDLDGLIVTGIWNKEKQRLEV